MFRENNPQSGGLNYALEKTPCSEFELFKGRSRKEVLGETKFDYILSRLLTTKTGIPHEVDHIKPLCAGGVHRYWNLSVMPMSSNRKKGAYWDQEDDQLTDEDIAEEWAEIAVECIARAGVYFGIRVPLTGEAKIGDNWKGTH